jgi:hypothetical protein
MLGSMPRFVFLTERRSQRKVRCDVKISLYSSKCDAYLGALCYSIS